MRKLFLAAGVAALAIAAPAAAKPDKAGGDRGPKAAKVEHAHPAKPGKVEHAHQAKPAKASKAERAPQMHFAAMQRPDKPDRNAQKESRQQQRLVQQTAKQERKLVQQNARQIERAAKQDRKLVERAVKQDRKLAEQRNKQIERAVKDERKQVERQLKDRERLFGDRVRDPRLALRDWDDRDRWTRGAAFGLIDGCPPGLAKKNNGCMPPGQAKKLLGTVLPAAYASHALPRELRYLYPDSDSYYYRYGDGYVYRVDRESNLVRALLPLIGAGLGIGQPFPFTSPAYHVPSYYQPFYPATDRFEYRYANGYIYEVDRFTGEITDIIPQYDQGYGVGQMLPAGYGYYNVPYPYRQWYVDDDDYFYRYAPGSIYQVSRDNNLITAIVSLLAGQLGVGQRLPMGYDAYNVPFAYRDRYYDTPDHWYRYSDGYIYQVDPTTRLITAVINAIA